MRTCLITVVVLRMLWESQVGKVEKGVMNLFIQHTSASLTCASISASDQLETMLNDVVPERWNNEFFKHTYEVCEPCRENNTKHTGDIIANPRFRTHTFS